MNTLTVQPFLLMFMVGIAVMALPIYQVCRRQVGTLRIDAFKVKPSAWRSAYRRVANAWRAMFADMLPTLAVMLLIAAIAHATNAHAAAGAPMMGVALIQIRMQERTDAKNQALALLAKAERTPDEESTLTALEAKVELLDKDVTRLAKLQDQDRAVAAAHAPAVEVGDDLALKKPASLGEVMQALAYQAFNATGRNDRAAQILPKGVAPHVIGAIGGTEALQAAASGASSGNAETGGLLVRNEWNLSLLERAQEEGKLAPRCFPMPIGEGNDGVEAPFVDETSRATGSRWGGVQVYRGAEADAMTDKKPKFGKFELRLEDLFGLFYATDRVLRDATLLDALAIKAFASEFAFKLDDEIVRGTGAGQCLGIVGNAPTVSVAKETNQAAGTVVYENVIKMYARLLSRCMPGAEWFINQAVWPQLFKMSLSVGTGGVPAFMPPTGLSSSPYGTLMGLPINVIEQASAPGTVGDIILANFKNDYALISKPMTSASSIHVLFTSNQTTFRWVWPMIGKPVLSSAITPYKGADTLGPFVTLATRA